MTTTVVGPSTVVVKPNTEDDFIKELLTSVCTMSKKFVCLIPVYEDRLVVPDNESQFSEDKFQDALKNKQIELFEYIKKEEDDKSSTKCFESPQGDAS